MLKLVLIAVGGGLGTLARYGITGFAQRVTESHFPFGTLAVNLLGCDVTVIGEDVLLGRNGRLCRIWRPICESKRKRPLGCI